MTKAQKRSDELGTAKISHLVFSFASVTLVSLLLSSVYTITDVLFVSWGVGTNAMGGISVVYPFVLLQSAISVSLGGGAASIVSRRLGEQNKKAAGEITFNTMAAFYSTTALISVIGLLCLNPLLNLFGVTPELYPYAKQYFSILLAFNVFSTGFSSIIRAEGRMKYSLLLWVLPTSLNIALDALFVLVLKMGVAGSALATGLCQVCSFALGLLFFTRFSSQDYHGVKIRLKTIGEIFLMGFPSLVQMGSVSISTLILNNVLRTVSGTAGVTAFAYLSKIILFAVMPFTALTQALSPIAGYNHGAGKPERVRKAIFFCTVSAFIYAAFAIAAILIFPGALLRIFTNDGAIIAIGKTGLRITAISLLFTPLPMIFGAAFQAVGNKLWALILYAANLAFLIPAAIAAMRFGIGGIWWAYVLAAAAASVLTIIRLLTMRSKQKAW